MPSVLFICTGNLYRSPLAAAFFRERLKAGNQTDWLVESAGTWTQPGQSAPPAVLRAAAKFGVLLEGHRSQLINADLLAQFDLALVMEKGHKEALDFEFPFASQKIRLFSQVTEGLAYDIPDPLASGQEIEALAAELHKLVEKGYAAICELALEFSNHH